MLSFLATFLLLSPVHSQTCPSDATNCFLSTATQVPTTVSTLGSVNVGTDFTLSFVITLKATPSADLPVMILSNASVTTAIPGTTANKNRMPCVYVTSSRYIKVDFGSYLSSTSYTYLLTRSSALPLNTPTIVHISAVGTYYKVYTNYVATSTTRSTTTYPRPSGAATWYLGLTSTSVANAEVSKLVLSAGNRVFSQCYYYGYFSYSGSCVAACPPGTYQSLDSRTCVSICPAPQKISADGIRCLSDCPSEQTVRTSDNRCMALCSSSQLVSSNRLSCVNSCAPSEKIASDNLLCVTSCGATEFVSSDNSRCVAQCNQGEFQVTTPTPRRCAASCPSGQYISTDGVTCVSSCASSEFISSDNTRCVLQCNSGEYGLVSSSPRQCSTSCPSGNLIFSDGVTCFSCPRGQYYNGAACATCASPNVVSANQASCLSSCPAGENMITSTGSTFPSNVDLYAQCGGITGDVQTYGCNSGFCSRQNPYYWQCLPGSDPNVFSYCEFGANCPTGQYRVGTGCQICNGVISVDGSTCSTTCGATEYIYNGGTQCTSCNAVQVEVSLQLQPNAPTAAAYAQCGGTGSACSSVQCTDTQWAYCPTGQYCQRSQGPYYWQCVPGSSISTETQYVCSCPDGFQFSEVLRACIQPCPAGQYRDSNRVCQPCSGVVSLLHDQCLSTCPSSPANQYKNGKNCAICSPPNSRFQNLTGCVSQCPDDAPFSFHGFCTDVCPSGKFDGDPNLMKCANCSPSTPLMDGASCISACGGNLYPAVTIFGDQCIPYDANSYVDCTINSPSWCRFDFPLAHIMPTGKFPYPFSFTPHPSHDIYDAVSKLNTNFFSFSSDCSNTNEGKKFQRLGCYLYILQSCFPLNVNYASSNCPYLRTPSLNVFGKNGNTPLLTLLAILANANGSYPTDPVSRVKAAVFTLLGTSNPDGYGNPGYPFKNPWAGVFQDQSEFYAAMGFIHRFLKDSGIPTSLTTTTETFMGAAGITVNPLKIYVQWAYTSFLPLSNLAGSEVAQYLRITQNMDPSSSLRLQRRQIISTANTVNFNPTTYLDRISAANGICYVVTYPLTAGCVAIGANINTIDSTWGPSFMDVRRGVYNTLMTSNVYDTLHNNCARWKSFSTQTNCVQKATDLCNAASTTHDQCEMARIMANFVYNDGAFTPQN